MPVRSGPPPTTYAASDVGYVAYQTFGDGPDPVLFIPSWVQNLDVMWDEPGLARYLDRLGSFGRVIAFDKRGSGVSDPVPLLALPTIEQWMDDARIALDDAGIERTAIIGDTEGGPIAAMFAATIRNGSRPWSWSTTSPVGAATTTTRSACLRGR